MMSMAVGAGLGLLFFAGLGLAQTSLPPSLIDYAAFANWLCRPGRNDACRTDLRSTVIDARGRSRIESTRPHPKPHIDCFYVYPTVSEAPGVSAPIGATAAEARAVRQQFARFASVCRVFAPLYRQVTLTTMKRAEDGLPPLPRMADAPRLAEQDVAAAWRHYLQHDNGGRGVVLIGHSQGAGTLLSLIAREIDGKAVQDQLVSAVIAGQFIEVAKGRDRGGTFKAVPACRSATQIGCVIAFDAWREADPPAERPPPAPGNELLCVNPAALGGGTGILKPFLSTTGETIIPFYTGRQGAWTDPPRPVRTPFVQLPGLLAARCVDDPRGDYLAVSVQKSETDVRRGEIAGDLIVRGKVSPDYGLHLIDLNLTMGNLLEVIARQGAAYRMTHASEVEQANTPSTAPASSRLTSSPALKGSAGPVPGPQRR